MGLLYRRKGMVNLIHRSMTDSMNGRLDDHIFSLAVSSLRKHVEKEIMTKVLCFPEQKRLSRTPEERRTEVGNCYQQTIRYEYRDFE